LHGFHTDSNEKKNGAIGVGNKFLTKPKQFNYI